jgi:CheY-like chemotaxis protein
MEKPTARQAEWGSSSSDFHGLKVLVAEDEAVIALDLEVTLRQLGCVVLPATSSVAGALALLEAERPDVALVDTTLADGSAVPLAKALAAAGIPFAVATGCDADQLGDPALCAAPYLGKPYGSQDLCAMVAQLSVSSRSV